MSNPKEIRRGIADLHGHATVILVQLLFAALACSSIRAEEKPASVPANSGYDLTIEPLGFAQLWYTHDWDHAKSSQDQFSTQRIRPGLLAKLGEKMQFFMLTEFGDANPGGSGAGSGSLLDAHATYKYNDLLNIRFGQDWYRFSLEGTWTLFEMPFITRSEVVDGIWLKMGRNGSFSYDRGFFVFGNYKRYPYFGYTVSLTNGTGLNKADDNNRKDVVGRIFMEPYSGLHIGFSGFSGASRVSSNVNPAVKFDTDEEAYGLEYSQVFGKIFRVIAEYLWADYKGDGAQGINPQRPRGWYVAAGCHPFRKVEFLVRQAEYDANNLADQAHIYTTTFGLTYTINGFNNLRLNYLVRDPQRNYASVAGVSEPRDLLILQWQLFFFPADMAKRFLQPFAD